jgi:hypothetical protein
MEYMCLFMVCLMTLPVRHSPQTIVMGLLVNELERTLIDAKNRVKLIRENPAFCGPNFQPEIFRLRNSRATYRQRYAFCGNEEEEEEEK